MAANYVPRLREAANAPVTHAINSCGMPPMAVVAQADLTAALDELERLREERGPQHPAVAELMRLTPQELSALRCVRCSPNLTMVGLWCLCIAACGSTNCEYDAVETDGVAVSAAPDGTGATLPGAQRADGLRDLTKLEGPQQGSEGDGGERG